LGFGSWGEAFGVDAGAVGGVVGASFGWRRAGTLGGALGWVVDVVCVEL
jgi:hypothetical protein